MTRRVVFVVYPDLQILDLTGPLEVFSTSNRWADGEAAPYATQVVTIDGRPVRSTCGLEVKPDRAAVACRGPIDTLVVVGGQGTTAAVADSRLVTWIGRAAKRSRRVTSVCSGAFLLAQAGVLHGRRATTHWSNCDDLARYFPSVTVDADPIFVRDGEVWTSAGVTAGMDLALALVEDDLGADLARQVARWLVLFVQRPGGQAQFSAQLGAQQPARQPLRELEAWLPDHIGADLSVAALAARAGMSTRNFARTFRDQLGVTPAAYVEAVRIEAAKRLLETTHSGLADVAVTCGFGTTETMHRSFKRTVRVTPGEYRRHFSPRASA